jgi:AmmeMemoRadiSam system protein A
LRPAEESGVRKGDHDMPPATSEIRLSAESEKELLAVASEAVEAAVTGKPAPSHIVKNPELQVKAGCFVTLKNKGRLRGCIGCFTSNSPLWKTVREMAAASAVRDDRFRYDPILPSETAELDIEISALSPMREVSDPFKEIVLGRDGVVIEEGGRRGTFLPQVASETGWSLEEFMGHCARDKAGIGWDGWKRKTAKIWAYTVTIVREAPEKGALKAD